MNSYKTAPLVTTPRLKNITRKYNASFILEKAKNQWLDGKNLWDSFGIFITGNKCPLCSSDGFQIIDEPTGFFSCSNCSKTGGGLQLIQHFLSLNYDEAIEIIGRRLGIREKEVNYGKST